MPLQGARGGDPPGGNRGNRRRGGANTRVVTVVKSSNGIFKPQRGGGRGGGRGRGFQGRGRGGFQGRGGSRGRGGRGRGRGRPDYSGPSFIPEGKRYNDLTDQEKEEVEQQRNAWKAAQLDKDLISFMAAGGKSGATSMLDDDLENYKKQGAKQKAQPQAAQPDQSAAEPMEQ